MIQPDRLKDIIKNNIPFWYIEDNQVRETHQAKYWKIAENKIVWYADNNLYRTFETIFETKEEAEWYLEFGNITRTETLNLPSWEEIPNEVCIVKFLSKDKIEYSLMQFNSKQGWILFNETEKKIVEKFLHRTKENYIEACRLAKKLFLGEKE